jgi:hypothetical protein
MPPRRTLYLRPNKDTDIIKYIEPLLENDDFSSVIRSLVRDGIKFRTTGVPTAPVVYQAGLQSHPQPIEKMPLKKKEVSEEELEDRLDNF